MEYITLELRPRIQSCSVFILLKNSTESREISLRLKKNTLCLLIINNLFNIDLESLIIIPESLSSLNITNNWISFRIQSSPVDSKVGTFTRELINQKEEKNNKDKNIELLLPPKNIEFSLICKCCKNNLTNDIIVDRILPLPSDECDPYQWFCCSHNDDINIKTLLHPRENDIFYGSHYIVLNRNIFLDKFKLFGDDILCSRCLTVLGIIDINNFGNSIKFWNYSIQFVIVSLPFYHHQTSPWIDFKSALLYSIDNNDYFNREIQFFAVCKNNYYSLIIKPMEKNLCLLTESENSKLTDKIILNKNFVTKVFYRYEKLELNGQNNLNFKICRVSVKTIIEAVDNLILSSQRIPLIYRKIDSFYHVGYVL